MEPASLSIDLVGVIDPLIGLTCAVKAYRSFTPDSDSDALKAQFEVERLRFERWNRSVGADRGQLSADHQARSVRGILLQFLRGIHDTGLALKFNSNSERKRKCH
jgi:hypothetical protein